jgi:hypothetical protein
MIDRRSLFRGAAGTLACLLDLRGLSAAVQTSTSPYRRPKLKITDVHTAFVRSLHVRVYCDQGLVGDGEGVDAVSGGASIVAGFRYALVGQDPLNVDAIFERLRTSGIFAGAQAGQYVAALSAAIYWPACAPANIPDVRSRSKMASTFSGSWPTSA